jgi:hypothetical protein
MGEAERELRRLLEIMAALRAPEGGCPWDVAQDFDSIAPYTIEEAYEVADAIQRGDLADLRDELGDLAQDFNEMHDLAGQEPARLQAMIERWFSEAGACNVLPLDDTLNRFVSSNPHSVASRRNWVLQPGGGRIPRPNLQGTRQ